ncbi:Bacterial ribosome SSU maturation protein RimP [Candidatus Syntrophocurvum alkaliphilum]|uniref:Ribosome maturation factor RimP n=1 Tax=Candidatus Syntrophocurvum alkaliphilum TaxID=2293317 RepID=A0A6I6DI10_9FIRM|nr:ribosome maturation factor RimP [Candidatus Syntrophocurvum alkaliphilum]QGT99209.1 Bacterial ribosome SSU maturation protein RimP [Candidatus Syntrophocurvum alkaliphilum]
MAEDIKKLINKLIEHELKEAGIELVDIEVNKEDKAKMLRIFIDTPNGVTLDLCTDASKTIKAILDDHEDKVDYDYLEVSSPGINRVLKTEKDFKKFIGSRIKLKTYQPLDGRKNFTGILKSYTNENIEIEFDSNVVLIPRESIAQVKLHPQL